MISYIFNNCELVLSSYVLEELRNVVNRKFPKKIEVVDILLTKMDYEYVHTPDVIDDSLFSIRDMKDYPVLYTAILEDVDVLITGDKDFDDVEVERPEIMTPGEFIKSYIA